MLQWIAFGADIGVSMFGIAMKIIGPLFGCLALSIISFCTYTYFTKLVPLLGAVDSDRRKPSGIVATTTMGLLQQVLFTLLGVFLLCNLLFNYAMSMFMDAGTPPMFDEAKHLIPVDNAEVELGDVPAPKQCTKCGRVKPARAHHCSVCRRCVLKMDHHCPWINNCVGFRNYRHFCLFLLYLATSCVFNSFTCFYAVYSHKRSRPSREQWEKWLWANALDILSELLIEPSPADNSGCIMMSFLVGTVVLVAVCILGGMHVFLLLTNQTTIEFQTNLVKRREAKANGVYFRNPFDMGRRRNFHQVFGPDPFCNFRWLLPCIAKPPEGDGMVFPSYWRLKT